MQREKSDEKFSARDGFVQTTTIRVRYSETDMMGIVYNANYLSWFEIARTELCRLCGRAYSEWERDGYLLPVAEAHCRYRSPARYDDVLALFCRVPAHELKPHSILFEYEIRAEDDRLIAEGWTKHAFVDAKGRIYRKDNEFQRWLLAAAHIAV